MLACLQVLVVIEFQGNHLGSTWSISSSSILNKSSSSSLSSSSALAASGCLAGFKFFFMTRNICISPSSVISLLRKVCRGFHFMKMSILNFFNLQTIQFSFVMGHGKIFGRSKLCWGDLTYKIKFFLSFELEWEIGTLNFWLAQGVNSSAAIVMVSEAMSLICTVLFFRGGKWGA